MAVEVKELIETTWICDRCGSFAIERKEKGQSEQDATFATRSWMFVSKRVGLNEVREYYHFCPVCRSDFELWMSELKKEPGKDTSVDTKTEGSERVFLTPC